MTQTVDELRNEIRRATGRFEREISATFTKEDLSAICEALDYDLNTGSLPPKSQMRADILERIGERDEDETGEIDRPFRKDELDAVTVFINE
jgi:hypothetical protein